MRSTAARQIQAGLWFISGASASPPNDYGKWAELVGRTVRHWVEWYGVDEVRKWYFEVWNEPNLQAFFKGTRSQYFRLYQLSAHAIKAIDPRLRVGGPASSNFVPDARFDGESEDLSQHKVVNQSGDCLPTPCFKWKR